MLIILYIFSSFLFNKVWSSSATVTVTVEQGRLQGGTATSEYDSTVQYNYFKGIPYAAPPVGDLRFKPPAPPQSWVGIRDATQHGSVCFQYNREEETNMGSEDCLFLNVYTPNLLPSCPMPVLVFIHGGNYVQGSGNDDLYGPDILVAQGVVVVTLNYRLEVLGFLKLDIPDAPGNAGLKDQVAALQWVQRNIRNFGGDPNRVTLMGQGAGAASVGLHIMSTSSRGLFRRAILSSGTPLNDFSTSFECTRKALVLGTQLGYHTRDQYQLLQFLKTVPAERLVDVNTTAIITESVFKSVQKNFPFIPCPETCQECSFFSGNVVEDLQNGNIPNPVDIIIGHNNIETLAQIYESDDVFDMYSNFTDLFVPAKMLYQIDPDQTIETADRIIRFYFGDNLIVPSSISNMLGYLDQASIVYDMYRFVMNVYKRMRTYVYIMSAFSNRNINGKEASEYYGIRGTVLTDDLNYLFQPKMGCTCKEHFKPGSQEYGLVTKYSNAFVNFIKNGNPGVRGWQPYDQASQRVIKFVDDFSVCQPKFDDYNFWKGTYQQAGLRF